MKTEIGHALGLGHQSRSVNIMSFPYSSSRVIVPNSGEVEAILRLYGHEN